MNLAINNFEIKHKVELIYFFLTSVIYTFCKISDANILEIKINIVKPLWFQKTII